MKKILSLCLCLLMIFSIFPVKTFAEEKSLEEIIRPQIEAFAKSIDKPNASGEMEKAIIKHGISGNGKKLSVGKSHALTATLMNSELAKKALPYFLSEVLNERKKRENDEISGHLGMNWYVSKTSAFYVLLYDHDCKNEYYHNSKGEYTNPGDFYNELKLIDVKKSNKYDESLVFIVGGMGTQIDVKASKVYDDKIVYDVKVIFYDTFNFDTDNGNVLEDLLGGLGMLLFKPFHWEAKCDFQIEIPVEKPEENKVFGDSDGNGSVDVADAYFARLVAAKLVEPTAEQLAFCDVDSDGKITAIDANLIRKFALGIIEKLPIR